MPKVTEAHLEARREQIIEASLRCFARQGFHQTTMQNICDESELSPGAVYRYFEGKEDIIEAAAQRCQEQSAEVLKEISNKTDALEIIDELSEHLRGLESAEAQEGIRLNVQLWAEAMRNGRVMSAFRRMGHDDFLDILTGVARRAQVDGTMNSDLDPRSVAHALLSFWHGLELQKAIDPGLNVAGYLDVVKALFSGSFWSPGIPDSQQNGA